MKGDNQYKSITQTSHKSVFLISFLWASFILLLAPQTVFAQVNYDTQYLCSTNSIDENYGNARCGFWRTVQGYGEFVDSTSHANPRINIYISWHQCFNFYANNNVETAHAGFN
jgi:hypothetical protein